jgi:hypothetical protein
MKLCCYSGYYGALFLQWLVWDFVFTVVSTERCFFAVVSMKLCFYSGYYGALFLQWLVRSVFFYSG